MIGLLPTTFRSLIASLALVLLCGVAQAQVGTNSSGVLNPNLASQEQLIAVEGLGAAAAAGLRAGRPYLSPVEFFAVLAEHVPEAAIASVLERVFLPINLNTASREVILRVPQVGERMAHEFEEYRPYRSLEQFRREIGKYVDDEQVAAYEQYVFVPLDLNSASAEDLATIPGAGPRMVHEFLEYRPYVAMAQFRREIGKYVDDAEVARLERYFVLMP